MFFCKMSMYILSTRGCNIIFTYYGLQLMCIDKGSRRKCSVWPCHMTICNVMPVFKPCICYLVQVCYTKQHHRIPTLSTWAVEHG